MRFPVLRRNLSTALRQARPKTAVRTRFAPSPTGYLHIGSLRTALFNYLLAKATGGQFLLRIEDTDKARTVPDAEQRLYEDLRWAGIEWDEGPDIGGPFGPYKQSERAALHREHAEKLLHSGHAYRCFCSEERLHTLASHRAQLGLPSEYDRTCEGISPSESDRRAASNEPHVVRLRVPETYPAFDDVIYGRINPGRTVIRHGMPSYEDPILIKSDGMPTYHLANVVDDHHMKVTHVIRAMEWLPSTPKHLYMYNAFNWKPPVFAHVGLLQDENRQKFSKRNKAIDIRSSQNRGFLPEALANHVALLGWSHRQNNDVMSMKELIDIFDLKFTKGNVVVTEEKLRYLQAQHVKRIAAENGSRLADLEKQVLQYAETELTELWKSLEKAGRPPKDYIPQVLKANINRYVIPSTFFDDFAYFFDLQEHPLILNNNQEKLSATSQNLLSGLATKLEQAENWDNSTISSIISGHLAPGEDLRERKKALMHAIRWAVTGGEQGPGIAETLLLLGKGVSLNRIHSALRLC